MNPVFDDAFRQQLHQLLAWRRDVRRFKKDPLPEGTLEALIKDASLSPSVGNSQPWRWVAVQNPPARAAVRANFQHCNTEALAGYSGERAALYASLKLEGLDNAPLQLAVFVDTATAQGEKLGRLTMPETLHYSVVMAVYTLWLAARAQGIGMGWVSIIDPQRLRQDLGVNAAWELVAYLCIGYPVEEHEDPELERFGWQERTNAGMHVIYK